MILLVLSERERAARVSSQFRGGQARNKKRDSACVLLERSAVAKKKFVCFALHHEGISNSEINNQDQCGNPRMHGHSCAQSEDSAAEVEGVSGVRVGTSDGENFLFVKIAGRMRADRQSENTHHSAEQNASGCGLGKIENHYRERITETDAPACKKTACRAHWVTSACRRTASSTASTSISRMEGSAWSPRLYVVTARGLRRMMSFGEVPAERSPIR